LGNNLWDEIEDSNNNPELINQGKSSLFDKVLDISNKEPELLESENSYLSNPVKGMMLIANIIKQDNRDKTQLDIFFDEFNNLLKYDFINCTNKIAMPNEAQLYSELIDIKDKLLEDIKFSELVNKTHIGVGGSFSAGKSSFLNSILGRDLDVEDILPIDSVPTTSIPTYIVKQKEKSKNNLNIYTFNKDGNKSEIDKEALLAISHEFNKVYGFGLTSLINNIIIDVDSMPYSNIAFLDTPGYSKADGNQDTDKNIAKKHLIGIDSLIWLIDVDNGVIRDGDIQFIKSLNFHGDILFILNKADKKPISDIENIIKAIKDTLENSNINYVDIIAYSSHEREEYLSKNKIIEFLNSKNKSNRKKFTSEFNRVLNQYKDFLIGIREKNKIFLQISHELDLYYGDRLNDIRNLKTIREDIKNENSKIKDNISLFNKIIKELFKILNTIDNIFNKDIDDAVNFTKEGVSLYKNKEYFKAIENFILAIKLDDSKAIYYDNRGLAYSKIGYMQEARLDFRQALRLEPNNKKYMNNLKKIGK
jgi:tetratricopeptide (TPR) repeat protein